MVNSSVRPKTLLQIPLRALTAFGIALFSLNTLETFRREKKLKSDKLVLCDDSSLAGTKSLSFPTHRRDPEASWHFLPGH